MRRRALPACLASRVCVCVHVCVACCGDRCADAGPVQFRACRNGMQRGVVEETTKGGREQREDSGTKGGERQARG